MDIQYNGKKFKKIKELLAKTTIKNINKFLFNNRQITLSDFINLQEEENKKDARGSASNSGQWGSASNSGYSGSASNSGHCGSASNSGYSGSASNSGDWGSASNSGDWGSASNSGYSGSASNSGDWGISMSNAIFGLVSNKAGLYSLITELVFNDIKQGECISKKKIVKQNAKLIKFTKKMEGKYYTLLKNKIYEVIECDEIKNIVIDRKIVYGYDVIIGIEFGNDITIYNKQKSIEDLKKVYIVEKDGIYSHGETIENAIKDFRYKIGNRNIEYYSYLKKEKGKIKTEELIKAYRVITGSCEYGTKQFVENLDNLKEEYTIKEALNILKKNKAYRFEIFEKFITSQI